MLGRSTRTCTHSDGGADGEAHTESQKDFLQCISAIFQQDALGY